MATQGLFSVRERTDPRPSREGETRFEFLDRVAGPFWDRLRSLLEGWFAEYPATESLDLAQRFRSDDDQHDAAWWELYLHRVLTATGHRLTPHPEVPNTTKRPDFLVEEAGTNQLRMLEILPRELTIFMPQDVRQGRGEPLFRPFDNLARQVACSELALDVAQ